MCRSGTEKLSGRTDSQIRTLAGCRPWPPVWSSSACSAYRPIVIGTGEIHADGNSQTSYVSVRKRLKNSGKQCRTLRGEMPGQPANHLVSGGSGSSSHSRGQTLTRLRSHICVGGDKGLTRKLGNRPGMSGERRRMPHKVTRKAWWATPNDAEDPSSGRRDADAWFSGGEALVNDAK